MKYPDDLISLISALKKFPGVGRKTAERFAFECLTWPEGELEQLAELFSSIRKKIPPCSTCGCLTNLGECLFCDARNRDPRCLCILASPRDVYAIEETKTFHGLYHVIEHLLSPLDGRHASLLNLSRIEERIKKHQIQEVILAIDSTLEGDTTVLYLKERLSIFPITFSRLAFGMPLGSSIDHIDGGTLSRAFTGRQSI